MTFRAAGSCGGHRSPVRATAVVAVFALGGIVCVAPALAQETESSSIEEIVVTGSRIPRSSADMPTPTTVIDAVEIERSGLANLGEVMHELPGFLDGIGGNSNNDAAVNDDVGVGTAGLELINLRGLGVNRTLVLVNGRRHVAGSPGTSAVNIGLIPTSLIRNVEVITGGASAIYGADAVTGVVNFILEDEFEGFEVDVTFGRSAENDGDRENIDLTFGHNFAGGRGNVTLAASWLEEEEVRVTARDYANLDRAFVANPANTGPNDGIPDNILGRDIRFTPLNAEGVLNLVNNAATNPIPIEQIVLGPGGPPLFPGDPIGFVNVAPLNLGLAPGQPLFDSFTIDRETGEVRPFDIGGPCGFIDCDGGDGFRIRETNTLKTPLERSLVNLSAKYEFEPLTVHASAKYGRVDSGASGQASVFHDGVFGTYVPIRRDNPFLPPAMAAEMDARSLTVAPLAVVGLNSRSDTRRETYQFTAGGYGEFSDRMSFDFYAQYGRTDSTDRPVDVLLSREAQALDATTDANGNPVCRDPSNGCVPFNPFNRQASDEAKAFVAANLLNESEINQWVAGFAINGDLTELPAGTLQYAAGVEYRREESEFNPDELLQAVDPVTGIGAGLVGQTSGPSPQENTFVLPARGKYNTREIFAETRLPLFSDRPLLRQLDLELAARYADNSVTGGGLTYKSGLNWTVNDAVRFRSTYSHAIRAPNINELFAPSEPAFQFVDDPCHVNELNNGPNPANRQANCLALGIPPDFNSLANNASRRVTTRGNATLDEEEADTITVGIVLTPLDNLSFTVDYWDMDIEDAITEFPADDVLSLCVDGPALDPVFCDEITRDAGNQLININVQNINAASFRAEGWDFEGRYYWELNNDSSLDFKLNGTYLDTLNFQPNAEDVTTIVRNADSASRPPLRMILNTVYQFRDLELGWKVNYIGSSNFANGVQPEQLSVNEVESKTYHDLSVRYAFNDSLAFRGGVNNVGDTEPPKMPQLNLGGLLYDNLGRYYFVGLRYRYN